MELSKSFYVDSDKLQDVGNLNVKMAEVAADNQMQNQVFHFSVPQNENDSSQIDDDFSPSQSDMEMGENALSSTINPVEESCDITKDKECDEESVKSVP